MSFLKELLYTILSQIVYNFCRLVQSKKSLSKPADIPENYFFYEFEKAQRFFKKFNIIFKDKIFLEIGSGLGGCLFHILKQGAEFAYGIEIEEFTSNKSIELIRKFYKGNNFKIIKADARNMFMIKSKSVDIVVSDSVLEHITQIHRLFQEVSRTLKPGELVYFSTSPLWFTRNGGHLKRYIPIPWIHLLLPDEVILRVLSLQYNKGEFPKRKMENIINLYKTLGKLSIRKLQKEINKSNLEILKFENISNNRIKRFLIKFPLLKEFFAGNICVTLRNKEI